MKWKVHLTGEGYYWWIATTPVGPYYVGWNDHLPNGQRAVAEWFPMDTNGEPEMIAHAATEDDAKAAAEAHIKALSAKLKRWLK